MALYTLYEYKKDGLYNGFADACLLKKEFSNLGDTVKHLLEIHPGATLVPAGKAGQHYCSIVETENEVVHQNLGFYSLNK